MCESRQQHAYLRRAARPARGRGPAVGAACHLPLPFEAAGLRLLSLALDARWRSQEPLHHGAQTRRGVLVATGDASAPASAY